MKGAVPSPYLPILTKNQDFIEEVENLVKKYGHEQFFIAIGRKNSPKTMDWMSQSNGLSDGMIGCLRDSIVTMEKEIDKLKEENE